MEIFKDINGYEGLYQISNQGRIKSLNYRGHGTSKILNLKLNKNGYLQITLCVNNVRITKYIHRLVAEHFVSNTNNFPQVNHIDENKINNNFYNLEWCTSSYNNSYGSRLDSTKKPVIQLDFSGNLIKKYNSITEASVETGLLPQNIGMVCKGAYKHSGGFIWQYNLSKKLKGDSI